MTRAQAPPAADAALAGSPVARRLLREAPERLGRLDVVGPAGTGKSVLLDALADVMERAGHTVLRELPEPGRAVDARAALLVDDAHRLSPADLTRLTTLAGGEVGVLVVAHRPWPRPDGMSALGAALAARRAPLVLGALDRSGVPGPGGARARRPGSATVGRRRRPGADPDRRPPRPRRPDARRPDRAGRRRPDAMALGSQPPAQQPVGPAGLRRPPPPGRRARPPARPGPRRPPRARPPRPRAGRRADPAALDELVEAARAEGLLTAEGAPIPLVSAAVLERTPPATRLEMRRALAERELDRGGNVLAAARRLLGTGVSGGRVAGVFTAAGDESLRTGLPGAGELYGAAVGAGAPAVELASRRAEAALRSGDLDLALTQADQVLSAAGPGVDRRSRAGRDGGRRRPRPPRHARPQRRRVPLPRRADGSGGGARAHRHGRVGRGAGGARRAARRTSRRRCSRGPRS